MRPDDFFEEHMDDALGFSVSSPKLNRELISQLRSRPLQDHGDIEAAVALARLVHNELEAYGTGGGQKLDDEEIREAITALKAVVRRVGVGIQIPFRDYSGFYRYWIDKGAYGSWQARRDLLSAIFDDAHDRLVDLESRALESSLVEPVSPRGRTGWARIDEEVSELRRHFQAARTAQDYRNVGNDCVTLLEALSGQVYDPGRHVRAGESEPPVTKTKQRLERFVDDALPGAANGSLRKLARATIDFAQELKHSEAATRREAGLSADAVIQLANLLRRLDEPE